MKKTNLFLSLMLMLLISNLSFGQTQPPNGDFETWENTSKATGWTSSLNVISQIEFLEQTNEFHDGTYGAKITSKDIFGVAIPGICTYGNINVDMGAMSAKITGGKAFTNRPVKFSGWYKYAPLGTDSMIVLCVLTKFDPLSGNSDTVGTAFFINTISNSTYEKFEVAFEYDNSATPDTMNITILSSGFSSTPGSALIIDELKFDYAVNVNDNQASDFYIYPNPSNGVYNVNLTKNETTRFTVYNSLGQMVYQNTSNDIVNIIDLSQFKKGLYLLEINNGKSIKTRKLTLK